MGLYNFKPQFEQAILNRTKLTTIRGVRKHADGPGDTMHLYCGLRTKQARLLGRVRCIERKDICIWEPTTKYSNFELMWPFSGRNCPLCDAATTPNVLHTCSSPSLCVSGFLDTDGDSLNKNALSSQEVEGLFRDDGFPGGAAEALSFFKSRLPFTGHLYRWSWD